MMIRCFLSIIFCMSSLLGAAQIDSLVLVAGTEQYQSFGVKWDTVYQYQSFQKRYVSPENTLRGKRWTFDEGIYIDSSFEATGELSAVVLANGPEVLLKMIYGNGTWSTERLMKCKEGDVENQNSRRFNNELYYRIGESLFFDKHVLSRKSIHERDGIRTFYYKQDKVTKVSYELFPEDPKDKRRTIVFEEYYSTGVRSQYYKEVDWKLEGVMEYFDPSGNRIAKLDYKHDKVKSFIIDQPEAKANMFSVYNDEGVLMGLCRIKRKKTSCHSHNRPRY